MFEARGISESLCAVLSHRELRNGLHFGHVIDPALRVFLVCVDVGQLTCDDGVMMV
jgi:hypothetical protein